MRILWVATKSPVPCFDGGRLVALTTIRALAAAGHELTIVAPVDPGVVPETQAACDEAALRVELVPAVPAPWTRAAVRAARRQLPLTIARHALATVRARVDTLLATMPFDVVHAEQLHALAACAPASARGIPIVLRAHNVESDLWRARGGAWTWEAGRLARFEGAAVRQAAATIALTARDADRLGVLAGDDTRVRRLAAPFAADGLAPGRWQRGAPAIVVPASTGWLPNEEAVAWFTRAVWPDVGARLPDAHLHLFGARAARLADRVTVHAATADSADCFPTGAIVVVPLRTAIGVRMRILEAWARGAPVVATPAAIAGLDPGAERAVAVADGPDAIAAAIALLADDAAERERLIAAGRAMLRAHHDPAVIGAALAAAYESAVSAARART
jgi:hypothetical protein